MIKPPIFLLPFVLALVACDRPAQVSPHVETPAATTVPSQEAVRSAQTTAPISAIVGRGVLQADPATLAGCEPVVVNVSWDASKLHPEVTAVEIHAIAAGETTGKLFAAGGAAGAAATGAWSKPGQVFQARDTAGNELDRITLGGPGCG